MWNGSNVTVPVNLLFILYLILLQNFTGKINAIKCYSTSKFYHNLILACTCNTATLEDEFRNGEGSIPVGGTSIGGWIVWPSVIQY